MRTYGISIPIIALALTLAACSRSAQVSDPGGSASGSGGDTAGDGEDDGATEAGEDDGSGGGGDIIYPQFRFTGAGDVSCEGNIVGQATATLKTDIDDSKMVLITERTNFTCAAGLDECDAAKAQSAAGTATYTRVSDDDMEDFEKDDAFVGGRFAVFASAINNAPTAGGATSYAFDKPLPVFPFPSPKTRFKPVEDGATWTTNATGAESVNVTATMKMIVGNDNMVAIENNVEIPSDTGYNSYAKFPIPKQSIYRIDPKKRRVIQIEVTKLFVGSDCKEGKAYMDFKLCQVTTDGDVEDIIPCQ